MPSQSKHSYSKNMNSYNFWVSQIAKTKKKSSTERETKKPVIKPISVEAPVIKKPITVEPMVVTPVRSPKPRPAAPASPIATAPAVITGGSNLQENLDRAKKTYGQFSPYAQHSGSNIGWLPIGEEPSSSNPDQPHVISVNSYGELGCDCRGYIFHKGPEGKTCIHCKEFAAANN